MMSMIRLMMMVKDDDDDDDNDVNVEYNNVVVDYDSYDGSMDDDDEL